MSVPSKPRKQIAKPSRFDMYLFHPGKAARILKVLQFAIDAFALDGTKDPGDFAMSLTIKPVEKKSRRHP